jgi:hypothetical protein
MTELEMLKEARQYFSVNGGAIGTLRTVEGNVCAIGALCN